MKTFGLILISVGLALLVYVGYSFLKDKDRFVSPVPDDKGVKVIKITPTK